MTGVTGVTGWYGSGVPTNSGRSREGVQAGPRFGRSPRLVLVLLLLLALPRTARAQWLEPGQAEIAHCNARANRLQVALSTTTASRAVLARRCQDALETYEWLLTRQAAEAAPPPETSGPWVYIAIGAAGVAVGIVAGLYLARIPE